jgi:hypothetical protein
MVIFVSSRSLYLAGAIIWFLLFAFITWNELRGEFRQKEITREAISLSMSVNLLIGFTGSFLYCTLSSAAARL